MPMTLALLATSTLLEVGVGAATAAAVGNAILYAGWTGIAGALSFAASLFVNSPTLPRPNDGKQSKKQTIPPRISGFGYARIGGFYMLYEEKDGIAYLILALHDGLITSFEIYYLHDDVVTVTGGIVDAGVDGRYGQDKIEIQTRLGEETETAYSGIATALAPIWTAAHRGDGIASMAVVCGKVAAEDFSKIYPNQLPQPSAVMKLQACWDPRDDAQDHTDPDTWTFTENPVLQLLHYITRPNGMDQDVESRIIPEIESWKAAANVCDEEVALKGGGTELRYTAGGTYQHDNDPADVIAMILSTFDGWLGETGSGALKVFAGAFYEPTVSIGPNHITGFRVQRFTPDEQAVNEISFSYSSRLHKWAEVQGQSWRDEVDIAARGKTRTRAASLTWVQSHPQARRLCKREMKRATSDAQGSVQTDLAGFRALGERYIYLNIPDLPSLGTFAVQISNAQIDLVARSLSFDWVKVDASIDDWDETTEEGDPPPELDEVVSTGSDSAITAPPSDLNAADGVGHATITWRNPSSFNFSYAKVFRAAAAGSFGSSVDISGALTGALGADMTYTDTHAAGTFRYWVVAYTAVGQASTPTGPDTAVIS